MHRWYDNQTGRWISEDPIGFAGGDANLARYVGNIAASMTDPDGLVGRQWWDDLSFWENPSYYTWSILPWMADGATDYVTSFWWHGKSVVAEAESKARQREAIINDLSYIEGGAGATSVNVSNVGYEHYRDTREAGDCLQGVLTVAGEQYFTFFAAGFEGVFIVGTSGRAAALEAIENGSLSVYSQRQMLARRLMVNTGIDDHHIFTYHRRAWFKDYFGIDVNDYTIQLNWLEHEAIHSGRKRTYDLWAGWWDQMLMDALRRRARSNGWKDGMPLHKYLSRDEIMQVGKDLVRDVFDEDWGTNIQPYHKHPVVCPE